MKLMDTYRKKVALAAVVLGVFGFVLTGCSKKTDAAMAGGGHINWMTDWGKARQIALNEGKDLLIDFAGSDWCYWCKKLDAEVFSRVEFINQAKKDFVFVLVDFPSDTSHQSQALQQQNERLSQEFGVEGFPTVFLAHPNGQPYARTSYMEGGPRAYLEHLEELKQQKSRMSD